MKGKTFGPALAGLVLLASALTARSATQPGTTSQQCERASAEILRNGNPANPTVFVPGETRPLLGRTWDPRVHAFLDGAVADVLWLSTGPSMNVSLPMGTLMCTPSSPDLVFLTRAGRPFQVPLPLDCNLAGVRLSAQAARRA